jgi:hypothetical protein
MHNEVVVVSFANLSAEFYDLHSTDTFFGDLIERIKLLLALVCNILM